MPEAALLNRSFLERLERLTLHWQKAFTGLVGGHNPSRFAGAGQDFFDHRNFQQGDDLRAVNWRVFLRLERLFSKVFHLEPRIPMRLLIDASASMGTNGGTKLQYARQVAAALCYVGLVRLDAIRLHPFRSSLGEPFTVSGGRHRFRPVNDFLTALEAEGPSDFQQTARSFLTTYDRRGLVIVISDFLGDQDCLRPLEYLAEFGHELFLIQVWDEQDRTPDLGELDLIDSETGVKMPLQFSREAQQRYTAAFDEHAHHLGNLALAQGGRYLGLSTAHPIEEIFVDALLRVRGVA